MICGLSGNFNGKSKDKHADTDGRLVRNYLTDFVEPPMGEEVRCPVWADVVEREPSEPTTWADEIDRLRSDGPPAYAGDVPGAVLCRACGCSLLSDFAWECVGGGLIERRDFVDACLAWGWKPMWNTHRPECSRCGGDA